MKKFFKSIAFIAAFVLFNTSLAFAAGESSSGDIFTTTTNKIVDILFDLQKVVYIIGGFGLIAFAFAAIFGKISFRHLSYLSFSLFLVATMGLFVRYITGDQNAMTKLTYTDYCETHDCLHHAPTPDCEDGDPNCNPCPSGNCGTPSGTPSGGPIPNPLNPSQTISSVLPNLPPFNSPVDDEGEGKSIWDQIQNGINNFNHGVQTAQTLYGAATGAARAISNTINGVQNAGGGFNGVMNALGSIGTGLGSLSGYAGSAGRAINSWTNNPGAMNTFNNINNIIGGVGRTGNAVANTGHSVSNALGHSNGSIGGGLNAASAAGHGAQNIFNGVSGINNSINNLNHNNQNHP